MITLDTITRSLEIVLGGAVTTNQLPWVSAYADHTTTTFVPASNNGLSNSAVAVQVVAPPAASTQRQVKFLSVRNSDTVATVVTVQYNDNTTIRILWNGTLAVGDNLLYIDGEGFRVVDNNGNLKVTTGGAGSDKFNIISAGTQLAGTANTVVFSNSNGISFGMSNSSVVTGSYTVPTVPAQFSGGDSTGGNTSGDTGVVTGRLVLAGGNNVTLSGSTNAGSMTVTISGPNTFAQFSGGDSTGGNTSGDTGVFTGRLVLAGGNNITLSGSSNAGSVTITVSAFTQTVQTQGFVNALGASNTGNTAGNTGTSSGVSWVVAGSNNITVSESTAGGNIETLWVSGPTLFSGGVSNLGNTAGSTGTVSNRIVFVGSGGVSLSQSTGGASNATITIKDNGGTMSLFIPPWQALVGNSTMGQASLVMAPMMLQQEAIFSQMNLRLSISISSSSNSSHAGTLSAWGGIYTLNGSTLSMASSGSVSYAWTNTSSNSLSVLSGGKLLTIPINVTATPGDYWFGYVSRTTTANANWITLSLAVNQPFPQQSGVFMQASATSNQWVAGAGIYSTTTSGMPASIALSELSGVTAQLTVPFVVFANITTP